MGDKKLGELAFADQVQLAMLGTTVIQGGYLRTELIKAKSIFAEHLAVENLSAISGKFTELMAGAVGGARLEMGESGGAPYFDMRDEDELRVKLLQDRIEFYQGGLKAGEMYGAIYHPYPECPDVVFERFILSSPRDLHLYGGDSVSPTEYSYSNIRLEDIQLGLTHSAAGKLFAGITIMASNSTQYGGVRISGKNLCYANHPTTTAAANAVIAVSPLGNFYRSTSAAKYKTAIEPIAERYAENFFNNCQPSWYRSLCPDDRKDWSWYGYIADEVAKVEPRLVDFNKDGEPEGFAYDHVAPLLHVVIRNNRKKIEKIEERLAAIENILIKGK